MRRLVVGVTAAVSLVLSPAATASAQSRPLRRLHRRELRAIDHYAHHYGYVVSDCYVHGHRGREYQCLLISGDEGLDVTAFQQYGCIQMRVTDATLSTKLVLPVPPPTLMPQC